MAHPPSLACEHCRANAWRRLDPGSQLLRKQELLHEALAELGHTPGLPLLQPSPRNEGFRNSVKLRLEKRRGRLVAGLYDDNSHRVLAAEACPDHHPIIGRLLPTVLEAVASCGLPVYREASGEGLISHLVLRALDGQGALLCLVLRDHGLPAEVPVEEAPWWPVCQRLARQIEAWDGLCIQIQISLQRERGNRILGREMRTLLGPAVISRRFLDTPVGVNSAAFMQANLAQYHTILGTLCDRACQHPVERVADLFCGAGGIGLSLAARMQPRPRLLLVENDPLAAELLQHGCGEGVDVLNGDALHSLSLLREMRPGLLVVNPPRKGLGEELARWIADSEIPRVFYLSCNPQSLARDAGLLRAAYGIAGLNAWDMIPNSPHIECLMELERN